MRIVILDKERSRKQLLLKKDINSPMEALETFRGILQNEFGVPDDIIIERFKKAIGYED